MAAGQWQEAIRYLTKAHEMEIGDTIYGVGRLEHDIGTCYKRTGNEQEADRWFKESDKHGFKELRDEPSPAVLATNMIISLARRLFS